MKLQSPAKINLRLKVVGKRADGYHNLSMLMVPVTLFDTIELTKIPNGIELQTEPTDLPQGRENLVVRMAELFFRETGIAGGVRISLKKKIPIAAGLGGGSSNAATVLKGLCTLFKIPPNPPLLKWGTVELPPLKKGDRGGFKAWIPLVAKLGADIPFFLMEGPQRAEGIGEILSPVILPKIPLILINPGFPISTPEVFKAYNSKLTGGDTPVSFPPAFKGLEDLLPFLENDLEAVVLGRYPEVQKVKEELLKAGAIAALMSGSGATVFGIFDNKGLRDTATDRLKTKSPSQWKIYSTETTV
ncbi:MAG: 4-(cytidine 5'-diphospho)-2-C-methyl-D-erythritol kinase [bacterium]|nr:4-(cytidine 5'-diphospho)-2-C-methyl-D-erythritol kinase [bacterium]